jgi:hypothetical protein
LTGWGGEKADFSWKTPSASLWSAMQKLSAIDADTAGACCMCLLMVAFVLPAVWHLYDTDGHGGGLFKEPHMHNDL